MTTLVALVAVTLSVLLEPGAIVVGLAEIVTVGPGPTLDETVTVAEAVTVPPAPVAVAV
jgi:hypothetical protein